MEGEKQGNSHKTELKPMGYDTESYSWWKYKRLTEVVGLSYLFQNMMTL